MSDRLADVLLWTLVDVSIRWGLLIVALGVWFAIRPPRRVATRYVLCVAALLAGPALWLTPRWDAYVLDPPSATEAALAPGPIPDFSRMRPLTPAQVEAIEARIAVEARREPRPPAAPVDWSRLFARTVVAAWLVGTLLMLARLAVGAWTLKRWAGRGIPPTADDLAMLDARREAPPISRRLRLTRHPDVSSPVVVGGFAPSILLPLDWDSWPVERRRAAMIHELAHVRRYDDVSMFMEELLRAPLWFHPAVAWLLGRLDRERELLCDEAVVAAGADPRGLAQLLLDLSQRPAPRRLPSTSLPFLDRRATAIRIQRLLEDDMPRTLSRPSLARALILGSTALAVAVGLGAARVRSATARESPPPVARPADAARPGDEPAAPSDVKGPTEVAVDELAGVVVDEAGKPIEGALVDVWTWQPGNETRTDAQGSFRLGGFDKGEKVEVRISKEGRTPALFIKQPTGRAGWVVALTDTTYFEGRVTTPDGKPAADVLVRANCGPKQADGVRITEIWSETKTDADGRYRLYTQADVYDVQVRAPGVGAFRRSKVALAADQAARMDVRLEPAVDFRARIVDSLSGEPVAGLRLSHWQHPGVEGTSDADGELVIHDMLPGPFQFFVGIPGYARWWSEQAANSWERPGASLRRGGFQANFNPLNFELSPGMAPVTITVEPAVTVTGRVLDPDGEPVAGATASAAHTGTGNSLTGDTRFSVATAGDGSFTLRLPASGDAEYNLVAHDGGYQEWRTWANGVLPPIKTTPGETIRDVEIRLTRPATVKGRVTRPDGEPAAHVTVRASAADLLENRYYDPTAQTAEDGTYELKFIRPGEQFVQIAPFWLDARQAPKGTSRTVTLAEGEAREGVDFQAPPLERR